MHPICAQYRCMVERASHIPSPWRQWGQAWSLWGGGLSMWGTAPDLWPSHWGHQWPGGTAHTPKHTLFNKVGDQLSYPQQHLHAWQTCARALRRHSAHLLESSHARAGTLNACPYTTTSIQLCWTMLHGNCVHTEWLASLWTLLPTYLIKTVDISRWQRHYLPYWHAPHSLEVQINGVLEDHTGGSNTNASACMEMCSSYKFTACMWLMCGAKEGHQKAI